MSLMRLAYKNLIGFTPIVTNRFKSTMVSLPAAASSAQIVTLPNIPELYDENFLDVLIPLKQADVFLEVDRPTVLNTMMEALKSTVHQTFTENLAPAYSSTGSPTLDAFQSLTRYSDASEIKKHLDNAWKEDPALALRIIWCLRSIHDGKGEKEAFYRAYGWLFDHHPRTAILNLPLLVKPVCTTPPKKGKEKEAKSHGYWKDLLNILALATVDQFGSSHSTFLHSPRTPATTFYSSEKRVKHSPDVVAAHIEAARLFNEQKKAEAKQKRDIVRAQHYERLVGKLAQPKYRALYIAVSRLFAERLGEDMRILKKISLAGKWAPTPRGSHDRVTNISTAISLLLHHNKTPDGGFPSALQTSLEPKVEAVILRSFLQRWILKPLRQASSCPEPLMSANRWTEIRYNRVPSICMKNNTEHFFKHDPDGFQKYLISVESGKKTISGATLLPHELVAEAYSCAADSDGGKYPQLAEFKKSLAETKLRVVEAQWKTLIKNLQDSGSIENSIAICDVSGSMGSISSKFNKRDVEPILPAISLSLVLASLSKPPFNGGFITFSAHPKFVQLDLTKSLYDIVNEMERSQWEMNTDLNAVFLKLLLPLAVKNKVKSEDMIKRLFIFSDMQFDAAENTCSDAGSWATNYDVIEKAYNEKGYEVPQIVYWDLNGFGAKTFEVDSGRKGVAMMNGFSPALLKVFMGETEEVEEWEKVTEKGDSETVVEEKEEDQFTPVNVMKKALLKKSFEELVVVD